ncbi:hypothetical protein [Acidovorax sp.]|uniref:hypothetical protein n=1 Tax=Acidovorax sp. TaxID=1872122 RepID=UPI00391A87AE
MLLLIAVVAGLAAMGYMQWRERSAINSARQERQALTQADRAIITYASVAARLPCPDVDRDGLEDCGVGDQKGWLPSVTLSLAGADPGVGVGQLRYLVQRGGGENDLTLLTDSWRPLEYDDTGRTFAAMRDTPPAGTYQAGITTLADLCQRIDTGRSTAHAPGMAEVRAATVRTVAYALVHPGNDDADGNNSPFDGVNASADPAVEDPARRPLLSAYNDIVLEKSYLSLFIGFHCQPLIDSINTVALAHDVVEQVDELKEGNIESAKQSIAFAAIAAGITAIETTATVLEGVSEAGNAAAAWALCAATLGLAVNACAAAPQHTAAIVLTGVSIGLNAASIIANVAAAVMAGNALALADSTVDASTLTCPSADYSQALAAARAEVTDATNDRNAIAAELAAKRNELVAANIARTNAINTLGLSVRQPGTSSNIDDRVLPLLTAADSWETYSFAVDAATRRRDNYQTSVNNWNAQIATYANMIANRSTMLTQLDAEIAALDLQIAAAPTPAAKEPLQRLRMEKTAQRALLSDPVELQKQYDDAVTARNTAQSNLAAAQNDLTTAQANLSASQTAYQTAYNNLRNAGRYTIVIGGGPTTVVGCSSTVAGVCQPGDVNNSNAIRDAIHDLMGPSSTSPHPDSKYLLPIKIQRTITALEGQLSEANKRVTDAQNLVTRLEGLAGSPPPCNITGRGVTPMPPATSMGILIQVDQKGGIR